MTKKSKPASLTSSLLARKGRAEPSAAPYSIVESGRTGPSSSDRETGGLAAARSGGTGGNGNGGNGNGHSFADFGRLPLPEFERTRKKPEELTAQGDEVIPSVPDSSGGRDVASAPSFPAPMPETLTAGSELAAETPALKQNLDPAGPAIAMTAPVPSDPRPGEVGDDGSPGDDAETAINPEREAARDARLLRFVYVMAALTGIVAIVLYAGGWFIELEAPETAQSRPEIIASAEPNASGAGPAGADQLAVRPIAPESPAASPTALSPTAASPDGPSSGASIPPAPPIAAPNFGATVKKPPEIGVTAGGKPKAASGLPAEMAKNSDSLPDSKPAAASLVLPSVAPETTSSPPSGIASGEPIEAPKVASPKPDGEKGEIAEKVVAATPPEPPKPAEPLAGEAEKTTGGEPAAIAPKPDAPKPGAAADASSGAPKAASSVITPPSTSTTPTTPKIAERKPAATAAKKPPPKQVPNLRVLAPALVRPEPAEKVTPVAPKLAAARLAPPKKAAAASVGRYLIQLASVSSSAGAKEEWARLQKVFPDVFGGRELVVEKRAISGRGMFYRVQTGRFRSLEEARSICSALKAKKQGCLPVKR